MGCPPLAMEGLEGNVEVIHQWALSGLGITTTGGGGAGKGEMGGGRLSSEPRAKELRVSETVALCCISALSQGPDKPLGKQQHWSCPGRALRTVSTLKAPS